MSVRKWLRGRFRGRDGSSIPVASDVGCYEGEVARMQNNSQWRLRSGLTRDEGWMLFREEETKLQEVQARFEIAAVKQTE